MTDKPDKPKPNHEKAGQHSDDIFGFFVGKHTVTGDLVAPAFTQQEWGDLY